MLPVFGRSQTTRTPGPFFAIDCPTCHTENVQASSYELEERIKMYYFIPLPTQRERHVVCSHCRADRLTVLSFEEIAALSPGAAGQSLYERISFVTKFVAVASVILCIAPVVGAVLGLWAMYASPRWTWPFKAGLFCLVIQLLLLVATVINITLVALKVI
jgi:hypothetical protein